MVGEYSMNNWGGRSVPQFVVKDIEITNKLMFDNV